MHVQEEVALQEDARPDLDLRVAWTGCPSSAMVKVTSA
jgi:hypothetical protein